MDLEKDLAERHSPQLGIKFRVWDKISKKIYPVTGIRFTGANGEAHKISFNEIARDASECVLLQFTGLTDKNGVEIYEGDILAYCHYDDMEYKNENDINRSVVPETAYRTFVKQKGIVDTEGHDEYKLIDWLSNWDYHFKVIGNKFENPELMGVEQ